jgi:hypothetical protein
MINSYIQNFTFNGFDFIKIMIKIREIYLINFNYLYYFLNLQNFYYFKTITIYFNLLIYLLNLVFNFYFKVSIIINWVTIDSL